MIDEPDPFANIPDEEWKSIRGAGESVRKERDWRIEAKEKPIVDAKGKQKPLLANAIIAVRKAWRVKFNDFAQRVETEAGEEWSDVGDIMVADRLQHQGIHVSPRVAGEAVTIVAHENAYHPVRQYIDEVVRDWDGVPRIDTWLHYYLGAEDSPYARAIGVRWLISAVARIHQPGAKADCCLILEGAQGTFKSTALRTMGTPWFTDEMPDLGTKDAALQVAGAWIIELAELDAMSRSEVARTKSFMSRNTDRFRPPYGRNVIALGRQCVFAGTVNHSEYLKDETGGRRFWPIACGRIDVDALAKDRNDLWAEAATRYRDGESWWLDSANLIASAAEEQRARYVEDVWTTPIASYLDGLLSQDTSVGEILAHLGRPVVERNQSDQTRIARCLKHLRWERYQRRGAARREWRYRPVTTVTNTEGDAGDTN